MPYSVSWWVTCGHAQEEALTPVGAVHEQADVPEAAPDSGKSLSGDSGAEAEAQETLLQELERHFLGVAAAIRKFRNRKKNRHVRGG